jgi:hypothetical protein
VNDAAFKYLDLPLPARSIFMDLALSNPGGSADSTVVKLDRLHLMLGQNPIDAKMVLTTPVSDPNVDASVNGKVDLADLGRTVKLDGIDQLAGIIAANASVRARQSYLKSKQYGRVAASGSVDVSGVTVKGKALPNALAIQQASLTLAPQRAQLKSFTGAIGSSDIQASGTLENLLAFALTDDTLRGTATVRSNHFDLDEWKSGSDSAAQIIAVPPKIDFTLDATVAKLTFDNLEMTDARGRVRVNDQRATLQQFQMNTLGGQIGLSGYYETTQPAKPTFDVGFKMTKVDIPSAFKALTTVQMLAPIAKYATGTVTTDLHVSGALGKNMLPLFPGLNGTGTLQTSQLAVHDFPALNKIADVTKLQFLNDPTLQPLQAAFAIREGRLFVKPFDVKVGGITTRIAGSNGLDQSLQYTLDLRVPRAMLGTAANQALAGLISKAGNAGIDLNAAPEIPLAVTIGGTVTNPTVKADVGSVAASAAKAAEQAVATKVSAEAARLVTDAEQRATALKQNAQTLADSVKAQGYRAADSLVARAGPNPLLQAGAKVAADKLRKQSDDKSAAIVREASQRADSLVSAARQQASRIPASP